MKDFKRYSKMVDKHFGIMKIRTFIITIISSVICVGMTMLLINISRDTNLSFLFGQWSIMFTWLILMISSKLIKKLDGKTIEKLDKCVKEFLFEFEEETNDKES